MRSRHGQEARKRLWPFFGFFGHGRAFASEVEPGERVRSSNRIGRAVGDDRTAVGAGARSHVDDAVGGSHHLRIVLDHHQRVAALLESGHDAVDSVHVARMQTYGRFIQHKECVGEVGAERRCEVDALHFAARKRAALASQCQVAHADVNEVCEPRANFFGHQPRRFVAGLLQQRVEKALDVFDRQVHQIGHGKPGQRLEIFESRFTQTARAEALVESFLWQHSGVGRLARPQTPQQTFTDEACASAVRAQRVAAVVG